MRSLVRMKVLKENVNITFWNFTNTKIILEDMLYTYNGTYNSRDKRLYAQLQPFYIQNITSKEQSLRKKVSDTMSNLFFDK